MDKIKVGDRIKKRIDELNNLSDEELKNLANEMLEDAKITPVMTKWSLMNPNECYVTREEFEKLKPERVFIENGKPINLKD